MAIGDPKCPNCGAYTANGCGCGRILASLYKPTQYFTPEPRWKDKDGTEYVGLAVDMGALFKANEVNKNGDVFTQEAVDKAMKDWKQNPKGPQWDDPRPSWDVYFMSEAFRVSRRSLDQHTKHGCVLVRNRRIIATGFNSPPPGFIDSEADLERPGKYLIMSHAEVSAICNAALEGFATKDSIAFVSGFSCSDCYRAMWSAGIKEIIYAPITLGSKYSSEHISYLQAARNGPKLTPFSKSKMKEVIKMLDDEYDYIVERIDFNTPDQSDVV